MLVHGDYLLTIHPATTPPHEAPDRPPAGHLRFFGMNFGWMVTRIDALGAFILLGLGIPALLACLTYMVIRRRGTPVAPEPNAVERVVSLSRRPDA